MTKRFSKNTGSHGRASAGAHPHDAYRGYGLRISECLGLQWADVDYDNQQVFVRRSWTGGKVGKSKSAVSKAPVPLVPLLAGFIRQRQEHTPYGRPTDWVFASTRLKGKQPRVANMLVEDHLRPAAVKAGVLKEGEKVRFGFHNLRHSLASFLVRKGTESLPRLRVPIPGGAPCGNYHGRSAF
ncbi:MAG: site-specific integrase [Candidatus Sulfotelmatobacter sp.]